MRTFLLALVVLAAPALAAEEHCHSSKKGVLTDDPGTTNSQDCQKKGGRWINHDDAHCHATGDGITQEFPRMGTQSACAKAGGRWFGHGHEKL